MEKGKKIHRDYCWINEIDYKGHKERGRNNFPNYASELQATFARSQITKISK